MFSHGSLYDVMSMYIVDAVWYVDLNLAHPIIDTAYQVLPYDLTETVEENLTSTLQIYDYIPRLWKGSLG